MCQWLNLSAGSDPREQELGPRNHEIGKTGSQCIPVDQHSEQLSLTPHKDSKTTEVPLGL